MYVVGQLSAGAHFELPRGGGLLYCMFVPRGHLTWTFRPMVCKLISVWINIWMSPLCFPLHLKPRQVASVLFLGLFAAASHAWISVQRWRAYQRASSEREKPGCVGDSWPPVAAAASPTPHGCIYRASWMSHLAPCPLFLRQIYGSPAPGRAPWFTTGPPSPPSPPPSAPTPPYLLHWLQRPTISPPTKQRARHAAALSCTSRWRTLCQPCGGKPEPDLRPRCHRSVCGAGPPLTWQKLSFRTKTVTWGGGEREAKEGGAEQEGQRRERLSAEADGDKSARGTEEEQMKRWQRGAGGQQGQLQLRRGPIFLCAPWISTPTQVCLFT